MIKPAAVGLPLIALALTVAGCGREPLRDGAGVVARPGTVAVQDLRIGDCYADLATSAKDVPVVPCDDLHVAQVYARAELKGGYGPGGTDLYQASSEQSEAQARCADAFQEAMGLPPERSELAFEYFAPTKDRWEGGDRTVVCSIVDPTGAPLTESVLG